jgi:glutamate-1-semialdehyde 2,1-aminomutase
VLDRERLRRLTEREAAALDDRTPTSAAMFRRAGAVLAGGVASSFQAREPWPVYLARGEGERVWDVDANEFFDFHNGFSSMLQGHAHPAIGAAISGRYGQGTHFAAPTEDGLEVAEELARRFGLPRWRYTNSGTESAMGALRIARAVTGRHDVVKILGTYHGHYDVLMAGLGGSYQHGIPPATLERVHPVEFNDAHSLESRLGELERAGRAPACLILEAAMTHVGLALPLEGYLESVREITRRHGVLLIFDEVKTGLSIAAGGAVERFGVLPDMVTLAKALGGGLPAGAIGMSAEVAQAAEEKAVLHFGTFNGNPLGMAAARANLLEVLTPGAYRALFARNERLVRGCDAVIAEHDLPAHTVGLGSKGCVLQGTDAVFDYASHQRSQDPGLSRLTWLWFMNRGLYVTPGRGQEWNLSVAHTDASVERYLEAFAELAGELTVSPRLSGSARA